MKKGVVFSVLFLLVISTIAITSAQTNSTSETQKVSDAYSCLDEKVSGNCDSLSSEERIFSAIALGQCRSEVRDDAKNDGQCWGSPGSSGCKLKATSQAILALSSGSSTSDAREWLISQNRTPSELTWYLQIETSEPATCSVSYSGTSYNINILEDKTLQGNPGPGLSVSPEGYWLKISPNFFQSDFEVSCNQDFLTSLLFKESLSSTIHVYPESSSASIGGTTKEKVKSFCFSENNVCNYEGSLWAAFVLNSYGEDISSYLPYLITLAEDNDRFLPDSFLYSILQEEDYRVSLLSQQIGNKWWAVSGSKYYDTALALQPFQGEDFTEKTNAKQWLLDEQGSDGCWDLGSVKSTAFILSSVWPSSYSSPGSPEGSSTNACESGGNYCVSSGSCGGSIISEDSCPGFSSVCCTLPTEQSTCAELGGEICSSSQICSRGNSVSSADASGRACCVGGFCEVSSGPGSNSGISECEEKGGICRLGEGASGEKEARYDCSSSEETCYITQSSSSGSSGSGRSLIWVWILLILIVLTGVGILYKDKLRHLWLKIKSKFGKSGGSETGPLDSRRPPFPPSGYHQRPMHSRRPERRILPSQQRSSKPQPQRPQKSAASKELDDVLKKLKDMSR